MSKKNILFVYLDDSGFSEIDCSHPEKGNPGIGGTQFCFAMLLFYLNVFGNNICVYFAHKERTNTYPPVSKEFIVSSFNEAIDEAEESSSDLFLSRFQNDEETFDQINSHKVKCLFWAHNFLLENGLKSASKCKNLKRVIFVGRELYDMYFDDPINRKAACIENMFCVCNRAPFHSFSNNVVYLGALTRAKGFQKLAQNWKAIVKNVPSAHLFVMGSGALYNQSSKLGPLGLAEEGFENEFVKYLRNENGDILPSVTFLGLVKKDKESVFSTTRVGIVNPTGESEILPISALEMEAAGIPVVSIRKNGLLDAVSNKKTGLLFRTDCSFVRDVVKLLKDDRLFSRLSAAGPNYVNARFGPNKITKEWLRLFDDVINEKKSTTVFPRSNFGSHTKWLKVINHYFRLIFPFLPSVERTKFFFYRAARKMIDKRKE